MRLEKLFRMALPRRRPASARTSQGTPARTRLSIESLEDRTVPAVINVISTADNTTPVITAGHAGTAADPFLASSLRSAITFANNNAGGNTINLTVAGDYKITLVGTQNEADNAAGEFAILSTGGDLTIQNSSGGAVAVDGNNLNRVFDINPNFDPANPTPKFLVTLSGFTIQNGIASDPANPDGPTASGGGIRDVGNASLTLNNAVITNNNATADGGGVSFENTVSVPWTLTVNNSTISNNHAGDAGGGIDTDGSGKIFINAGTVISGNTTVNQGAGIWLDAIQVGTVFQGANLTVTGATISNNAAQTGPGGGIGNAGNGTVTITNSTLSGNFAGMVGGGFGDENAQGTLVVQNSLFVDNYSVGNGGGIAAGGPTTTITNTELKGNSTAGSGGALFANGVTLTVLSSTLTGNSAATAGGGIELQTTGTGATGSTITNTTIAGNTALNNAGANGGGIDAPAGFTGGVALENDTINANFATNGGGIFWAGATGSTFSVQNTILAGNKAPTGRDATNTAGNFTDGGGNLIGITGAGSGNTGFTVSTQTGTVANPLAALLGPLQNNGGPTAGAQGSSQTLDTEILLSGSTAIRGGVTTGAPTTDERGFNRPAIAGQKPDIGAFEFQNVTLNVTITPQNPTVTAGGTEVFTITVTNTGTNALPADNTTLSVTFAGGLVPVTGTPLTLPVGALAAGQSVTFTLAALATTTGQPSLTATVTGVDLAHAVSTSAPITVNPPAPNPFANLTPQERFVQALYLANLGRAGAIGELDGWVAVLNGPGGARAVINGIEGSFEARDRVVKGWYQTFLGRTPVNGEENSFVNQLATLTQEQVLSEILSSDEFHGRAQILVTSGTVEQRYVSALYQLLLNRAGDAGSVATDANAIATMGRQGVVLSLLHSTEYRADQITGYFNSLLNRAPDAASLNSAASSPTDLHTIRMNIESSAEFFANGV